MRTRPYSRSYTSTPVNRAVNEAVGAMVRWGIILTVLTVIVMLVLSALIGIESVSNGTNYFVPENPVADQQQPFIAALNG